MKYALFLGCTAPVRAQSYELATRTLLKALEIEIVDLDFVCCGYPVEPASEETAILMAVRNLALAEKKRTDILTICNACFGSLSKANYLLKNDASIMDSVNRKLEGLDLQFQAVVKTTHLIDILSSDFGLGKIEERIKRPLKGIRLAAYYGCHYLKPSVYLDHGEDSENPDSLDRLIRLTGAESVSFGGRRKCCGGALLGIEQDLALAMSNEVLESIQRAETDAIVTICPFCGIMFDTCQREIEERYGRRYDIPVLYLPQLIGISIGLDESMLGLDLNRVSTDDLLERIVQFEG